MKKVFVQLRKEGELDILEVLLKDQSWSNSIRDDIVKVVELSQRQSGHASFLSGYRWTTWRLQGEACLQRQRKLARQAGATTNVDRFRPGESGAVVSQEQKIRRA